MEGHLYQKDIKTGSHTIKSYWKLFAWSVAF